MTDDRAKYYYSEHGKDQLKTWITLVFVLLVRLLLSGILYEQVEDLLYVGTKQILFLQFHHYCWLSPWWLFCFVYITDYVANKWSSCNYNTQGDLKKYTSMHVRANTLGTKLVQSFFNDTSEILCQIFFQNCRSKDVLSHNFILHN